MTKDKALKLALEWAEAHGEIVFAGGGMDAVNKMNSWVVAIKEALAQPAQKPVAHCEAGPEYCVQCKLEDRSIVLAAAVRYVKNNTPPLVSDEICMALATPPQRSWVGLTAEEAVECCTISAIQTWKNFEAKLKEKNSGTTP